MRITQKAVRAQYHLGRLYDLRRRDELYKKLEARGYRWCQSSQDWIPPAAEAGALGDNGK